MFNKKKNKNFIHLPHELDVKTNLSEIKNLTYQFLAILSLKMKQ